jgi:REP element-mobilizing transposase RayT
MESSAPNKNDHYDHAIRYRCQTPVVFCPQYRRKVLRLELQVRFKELLDEKQEEYG